MSSRLSWNIRWRLSVLWLLEWGISGTIMTYLPIYWESIHLSKHQQGQLMAVMAIGLWVAPFVVGQIADRWLAIEKYIAISHFVGGASLYFLAIAAEIYKDTGANFQSLLVLCGVFAVAYFPTVPLASALCFRHLSDPDAQFGKVRIWGTAGWMLSGLTLSLWLGRDQAFGWLGLHHPAWTFVQNLRDLLLWLPEPSPSDCFRMSAILSFALSSFCIFLPHTPPPKAACDKVAPLALLSMFRDRNFSMFIGITFLLAALIVPLYTLAVPNLLHSLGVDGNWVPTVMLVGQLSEFPALLLLSLCLKRLGMKLTFALGIAAWALRYTLFAVGETWWLVMGGLVLHGVCHVFLIIVAQLYIDAQCRKDLRASAQIMLSFITLGIGMPLGAIVGGMLHEHFAKKPLLLFTIPAVAALALLLLFWKTIDMSTSPEAETLTEPVAPG